MSAPCPALGFVVEIEVNPALSADRLSALRGQWTAFLDARGLRAIERRAGARMVFEIESEAAQATQSDRVAAEAWLSGRMEVRRSEVGEIRDLRPDL